MNGKQELSREVRSVLQHCHLALFGGPDADLCERIAELLGVEETASLVAYDAGLARRARHEVGTIPLEDIKLRLGVAR